ncbi:MAG: hypothetical protein F6J98_25220, partial [Moorea sp. SIO4G2]|nr:hypothetical protein [Moorena sp. SIO4G2]
MFPWISIKLLLKKTRCSEINPTGFHFKISPLFPIPDSRFPIPDSRFPIPDSRFPIPDSRFPIP